MQPDKTKPLLRFRKLRIAWSVFWGLACVLLIVLWVRSYWCSDVFNGPGKFSMSTENGVIEVTRLRPIFTSRWSTYTFDLGWKVDAFYDDPYASLSWDAFGL